MADDDDYGGMEDLDFEWIYVEDDFPLSDELAETQIPDPGYAGTNFEIYQDHDDLDWLGYWEEREYIDDEYWDSAQLGALAPNSTAKRKREENIKESPGAKRRRVLMQSMDNVKYASLAKRLERYYQAPPSLGAVKAFALLPDWQKRFAKETGVITEKAMPEAMKKAAEAQDDDTPPTRRQFDALAEDGNEDEWMDEEDGDEEGEDIAAQLASLASLDPEALNAVLVQKLDEAGLDLDADAIKQTIAKMLAGDDGADDAIGELAGALLGQATQGSDSALSGWLSQQGVSLDAADDEDDASSVATAELPSGAAKAMKANVQVSPPDSAIEISKQKGETKEIPMHGSSPSASVKKRAASIDNEDGGTSKRKRVDFNVPPTSKSTYLTADEYVQEEENLMTDSTHEVAEQAHPGTSEDPLMSEPTIRSTTSKSEPNLEKAKATNAKAVKSNKSASANSSEAKNYAKSTAAASAKQTRKRKAEVEADEDEIVLTPPKQKRPARKAAKTEPEAPKTEPPARRTRSARSKAGK